MRLIYLGYESHRSLRMARKTVKHVAQLGMEQMDTNMIAKNIGSIYTSEAHASTNKNKKSLSDKLQNAFAANKKDSIDVFQISYN